MVQETVREFSVTSLKTMSVGGSGPGWRGFRPGSQIKGKQARREKATGIRRVENGMKELEKKKERGINILKRVKRKECVHCLLIIHTVAISAPMSLCVYMYSANIYTVYKSYTDIQCHNQMKMAPGQQQRRE